MTLIDEPATFHDMQIILALLITIATASAQWIGESAAHRGNYFGILVPAGRCANERLGVDITVSSDGTLEGEVRNWDNAKIFDFSQSWPFFSKGKFTSDITGLGDRVSGRASSGAIRGSAVLGGCRYTFTAYRRFKVAQ